MKKITFPLKRGMQGQAVADLQDALLLCLSHDNVLGKDPSAQALKAALTTERAQQPPTYGPATSQLVGMFHREVEVDEPTADALNALLKDWGVLPEEPAPRAFIVSGKVQWDTGLPVVCMLIEATHEGTAVPFRLGEDTTDSRGLYTIRYESVPGLMVSTSA